MPMLSVAVSVVMLTVVVVNVAGIAKAVICGIVVSGRVIAVVADTVADIFTALSLAKA